MAGPEDETVRAARNQSLYRDVNERIQDLNEAFDDVLSFSGEWSVQTRAAPRPSN
jgi:hypothetical protein